MHVQLIADHSFLGKLKTHKVFTPYRGEGCRDLLCPEVCIGRGQEFVLLPQLTGLNHLKSRKMGQNGAREWRAGR